MTVRVREFRDGDWPTFQWLDEIAFGYTSPDGDSPDTRLLDHDRSLIAEVDGEPVGIASAYGFGVTVPGGSVVPAAGTTWVAVAPTHRRRGTLRAMMERHLADSRSRGDVLAVLWATEPGIYGRFGFGMATRALRLSVTAGGTLDRAPRDATLRTRLARPADVREALESVYVRSGRLRPGATTRDERWWDRVVYDPEHRRGGASEKRALLVEDADGVRGYALYNTSTVWTGPGTPDGTVHVRELVAVDAAARAQLWRVLLGHDLMNRTEWFNAPADEPLLDWVDDRAAVQGLADQVYVRVLDLPSALCARTYAGPLDLVVDVRDGLVAENQGRWHLSAGPDGVATCTRTGAQPHASLDARELAAAYLGDRTLTALAAAGLVDVHDPAAVAAAASALRHEPSPWCPAVF